MSEVLLTIAIPAYNRPEWFKRALLSILSTPLAEQKFIEVVVSDDSTIAGCKEIFENCIKNWHGAYRYQANSPSLGMAGNWNECIRLSSGYYILILHDDDYLEPNGGLNILKVLKEYPQYSVFLFGVNVVNEKEKVLKRQYFKKNHYLDRVEALKQVLTNSSFVRFPGIVIQKMVFEQVGYFDETIGEITDIDRWVRVFHSCGVFCASPVIANYTVHANALTMNMFNENIINKLCKLFDWVKSQNWLDERKIESCKANYFYQFILAGAIRYIKALKFKEAKVVIDLFNKLQPKNSQVLFKWKLIRVILKISLIPF